MMNDHEKPLVSVIMGVYNQYDMTALTDSVNSILNQTVKNLEFIIWDDGSEGQAKENLESLRQLDQRIILVGKEENRGLAFSLNECIKLAKGKYIARMDADDISFPERLEKQISFLEEHKDCSWVGCNAKIFDENGVWGERKMPEYPSREDYLRFSPYIHPSIVFRASIFDNEEGYLSSEETLRCEDYEIFMRLTQKGLKGANLQKTLLKYRENNDSFKKRTFKCRINEAKCRYKNFKNMGILFPFGWLYVLRPVFAAFVPRFLVAFIKHKESECRNKETKKGESYVKQQKIVELGGSSRLAGNTCSMQQK